MRCRSLRLTRWRTTELPTALLTTKPTRVDRVDTGRFRVGALGS